MKTIKQVTTDNKGFKVLINAVVSSIGKESIEDVNSHGMDAGFSGFTYYADTHKFAIKYQKYIVKMLEESAEQLGEDVVAMVGNFGYFNKRHSPMDKDDKKDLYKYLAGVKPEQGAITNLMSWFAAEEVCRMFEE